MRFSKAPFVFLLVALAGAGVAATPAEAQFGGLGRKLKQKAQQKVDQKQDQAAQGAVDAADNAVSCAASDKKCQEQAQAEGKAVVTSGEGGSSGGTAAGGAADAGTPGKGAWANYDFKPGDRVLYADDFSGDEVGDFPRRMEFKEGAAEIVEWNGGRWLRVTNDNSRFFIPLPEVLPQRFTMEFDYTNPSGGEVWISFGDENKRIEVSGYGSAEVYNQETKVMASGAYASLGTPAAYANKLRKVRVLADGQYVKLYIDDKRILNVPNADLGRSNKILFYTDAETDKPTMFGNFRIAAGGKKLYDALAASGRVATQGIYFDTGSDHIRGESNGTLKEIATMLQEHPDLKLLIEGHTDNVGAPAANLTLSQKRAEAVKAALVATYGVDASRLTAKGFGASKPAAPNTTPEGRQTNRRVELVKQ
jgi:outer membrane protein OmpA-like peptidoglycan-associated protein